MCLGFLGQLSRQNWLTGTSLQLYDWGFSKTCRIRKCFIAAVLKYNFKYLSNSKLNFKFEEHGQSNRKY
jgi:hypothetical protein